MSSEPLLSSIVPFAGSGVAGFFMGMFLRRVLKFLVIIIGSFLGMPAIAFCSSFEFAYSWDIGNSRNEWPRNRIGGSSSQIMRNLI
jgi:hypothetical protein